MKGFVTTVGHWAADAVGRFARGRVLAELPGFDEIVGRAGTIATAAGRSDVGRRFAAFGSPASFAGDGGSPARLETPSGRVL